MALSIFCLFECVERSLLSFNWLFFYLVCNFGGWVGGEGSFLGDTILVFPQKEETETEGI